MSETMGLARTSARGTYNLLLGMTVSAAISAFGLVILARLLPPSEYGLYLVVLIAPNFMIVFRDWGVPLAVIRSTAQYRAKNKIGEIKNLMIAGLIFELLMGMILTVTLFISSDFLATAIFRRPEIADLIKIASVSIVAGALVVFSQSAFQGYERMGLVGVTMIIQSVLNSSIAPVLVILGHGVLGAIVGYTASLILSGIVNVILFYRRVYTGLRISRSIGATNLVGATKGMLSYGLPLSICFLATGFFAQFCVSLMARTSSDVTIGNYQVASSLAMMLTFVATPLTTVLFPLFSKIGARRDRESLRVVFRFSVKYSALIVVPTAAVIVTLARPLVSTLFGSVYADAPFMLVILTTSYLLAAFGGLSAGNLLKSHYSGAYTRITLISVLLVLPLAVVLISYLGAVGLVITSAVLSIPSLSLALWYLDAHSGITLDWISSTKILAASALSATVTYFLVSQLDSEPWIQLVAGLGTFLLAYIVITPVIGAVDSFDIKFFREIRGELGPFSYIVGPLIAIMDSICSRLEHKLP